MPLLEGNVSCSRHWWNSLGTVLSESATYSLDSLLDMQLGFWNLTPIMQSQSWWGSWVMELCNTCLALTVTPTAGNSHKKEMTLISAATAPSEFFQKRGPRDMWWKFFPNGLRITAQKDMTPVCGCDFVCLSETKYPSFIIRSRTCVDWPVLFFNVPAALCAFFLP